MIPVLLVLVIAVISIIALVSLGRAMFRHDSGADTSVKQTAKSDDSTKKSTPKNPLLVIEADRGVVMSVRGPIVGDEDFRSYKITITPDKRQMTTYKGYLKDKIDSSVDENNIQAYTQLVYALSKANYMAGTPLSGSDNDLRGVCATGYVYEFAITQGDNEVKKLWTSTCDGSPGSLAANLDQITDLFRRQIPEFYHLSDAVDLP